MTDENLPAVVKPEVVPIRRKRQPAASAKQDKFERLANSRAAQAIGAIQRLGNLSSPAYQYTDAHVVKLEKALGDAVRVTIGKLRSRTARATGSLNLF